METPSIIIDHLDEIAELAEALTPIDDIALILQLDLYQLRQQIRDTTSDVSMAYRLGKARGLLAVRRATIKKAESGDVPAAAAVERFAALMGDNENL